MSGIILGPSVDGESAGGRKLGLRGLEAELAPNMGIMRWVKIPSVGG
jgi:hypothetical protein